MQISIAQNNYYLKAGLNTAKFRTEKIVTQRGITMGGGYAFHVSKIKNSFIALELLYTTKKALLKDRTVLQFKDVKYVGYIEDIEFNYHYLEFPLKYGWRINLSKNKEIILFSGFTWNIPLYYRGVEKIKHLFSIPRKELENQPYDYWVVDLDESAPAILLALGKSTLDCIFALKINFNFLSVEFNYSRAIHETKEFSSLTLRDKIDTYTITMGYNF